MGILGNFDRLIAAVGFYDSNILALKIVCAMGVFCSESVDLLINNLNRIGRIGR